MPRYVAFLRAINVGGHNTKMAELRRLFEGLGFSGVEPFIASGNVIFETNSRATAKLEGKMETCLSKALGYQVSAFVRTDSEVAAIAQFKPFPDSAVKTARACCVGFVAAPLGGESQRAVMGFKTAVDDFHVDGREIYWLCRTKQGQSTFSNAALERRLGIRATFRGIKTIHRLACKYPPLK